MIQRPVGAAGESSVGAMGAVPVFTGRQAEPVRLANDRVAANGADYLRNLGGGHAVAPQLLQFLDPFFCP